jgi:hypothetical protein
MWVFLCSYKLLIHSFGPSRQRSGVAAMMTFFARLVRSQTHACSWGNHSIRRSHIASQQTFKLSKPVSPVQPLFGLILSFWTLSLILFLLSSDHTMFRIKWDVKTWHTRPVSSISNCTSNADTPFALSISIIIDQGSQSQLVILPGCVGNEGSSELVLHVRSFYQKLSEMSPFCLFCWWGEMAAVVKYDGSGGCEIHQLLLRIHWFQWFFGGATTSGGGRGAVS